MVAPAFRDISPGKWVLANGAIVDLQRRSAVANPITTWGVNTYPDVFWDDNGLAVVAVDNFYSYYDDQDWKRKASLDLVERIV